MKSWIMSAVWQTDPGRLDSAGGCCRAASGRSLDPWRSKKAGFGTTKDLGQQLDIDDRLDAPMLVSQRTNSMSVTRLLPPAF
jgi:hypothetical protein